MNQDTAADGAGKRATLPPRPLPPPDPTLPWDPFPNEFRLLRRLGRGAFGEVWLAEDLSPLGRLVALKFVLSQDESARQAQALTALRNDARVLASLSHPNIVQVYAWRQPAGAGAPCLVLQYVAGGSLHDRVARDGPLPWHLAARYVADVADGLTQVHRHGLIHRDIKPANVLWDPHKDEALLTDFGVAARLVDPACEAGTPLFMAPESFRGVLAVASDVYGLAATLFWLVTAEVPFTAPNRQGLLRAVARGLPDSDPRCHCIPAALERLIRTGLAARLEERPTLPGFAAALRGSLNLLLADTLSEPPTARRAGKDLVNLKLRVSRQVDSVQTIPIASSERPPERFLRDLKRVPPRPVCVTLHTGDRVRLEVEADRAGYVTVFNVGPAGALNLLYPTDLATDVQAVEPNRPLHILDVELTPPTGIERVFALWTRERLPLRPEEMLRLAEQGGVAGSGPYRATRDMERIRRSLQQLHPEDRCAVVLEVDHH
jgi:serine/threonine protein kinase